MIGYLIIFLPSVLLASITQPQSFPVFLKAGFSTILEFEENPERVVLGDTQSFQIEKLGKSLVLKTLVPYATSNMFVYFGKMEPKLFVLTASEEVEPTYYKKFESLLVKPQKQVTKSISTGLKRMAKIQSASFTPKKDFLIVEVIISADSQVKVLPQWDRVRLKYGSSAFSPERLWAERKEIQKDSSSRARFVFRQPNIPRNYTKTTIIIPTSDSNSPFVLQLSGSRR